MKLIALLLMAVLALNATGAAVQMDTPPVSSRQTNAYIAQGAEVKSEVTKRGVGKQSRVRVSLHDGTEVKGYISAVDDSSFAYGPKRRQGDDDQL